MKLHLIWDMDGTLVDSEPEILTTVDKALSQLGLSVADAASPLRIGPPLPVMLRAAFTEQQLTDSQIAEVIGHFRIIYDASDFKDTKPFPGIDDMIHDTSFVHHVVTNKPHFATNRILQKKEWDGCVVDVLSPDTLIAEVGKTMTKPELFQTFHSMYPDVKVVGIGDMAKDAECAISVGYPAVGVLWGTGTREELKKAGCSDIVSSTVELIESLKKYE